MFDNFKMDLDRSTKFLETLQEQEQKLYLNQSFEKMIGNEKVNQKMLTAREIDYSSFFEILGNK